ncbi:MAG: serine--tRNA ligase [candidate division Zixibacteria bacterium]|nr:serine--tRNA ligase [candidate division Zixibacteria bacterium]
MFDLKFIRENKELVKKAIQNKNESLNLDELLGLDEKRREIISSVEELKRQRNLSNQTIALLKKEKKDAKAEIEKMRGVSEKISSLDNSLKEIEDKIDSLLLRVPNIPHSTVPVGFDENSNVVIKEWGELPEFSFEPRAHWEIGELLGILDLARGAKLSGSGFYALIGKGALLERGLINFMLDLHTKEHGYKEVWPPFMVNRASMTGTGQLPKLEEDMYLCEKDDLFLVPTAEVPVTNLHRDEILKSEELPIYYVAYTPCFRREAGSYGKDTRGILRVHQFDKVEMVKFVKPEDSYDELEKLVANAEEVLQLLNIPYRVRLLCTGDLSFAAAKCYDIEAWAPGVKKYLEVSSCSNYEAFQSRRIGIKFKPDPKSKAEYVHTLNGSGVALARTVAAFLENFQTEKGTVVVPEVLRPYLGGLEEIS